MSSEKNIEGFNAYDMYNLFKAYKQFVKEKRDYILTEREFLGLMIYRDGLSSGQLYANEYVKDKIIWAATVQLWSGHRQYYCSNQDCLGGLFNFIAAYLDSAWEEYKSVVQKKNKPDFMGMVGYFNSIDAGRIIGDEVMDPKDTSRKVYTPDVPLDWGNPFDPKGSPTETLWWLKIFDYQSPVRGAEYNKIYYFDKTANFVIHSDNQRSYWVSQCERHEQCKKNKPK